MCDLIGSVLPLMTTPWPIISRDDTTATHIAATIEITEKPRLRQNFL